ncbi:MAG: sugar phosphate isomerase/epimerase [Acidobacteriota bacterium]|nr:MAG: sugar phosphate isomerase/epimerase [Acidobacteriota bacterium]
MNRRNFLTTATGGALAALAPDAFSAERLNKIGVQLYTVRNEMAKDFDGSLRKIAGLGYKQVEFAGYYNRDPKQIRALLDSLGLEAPAAHVPLRDIRESLPRAIETARIIGHRYLICPYLMENERKTLDQYREYAALFNKAGEECRKAGIQFGYHNHDFEFMPIEGKMPFELLLAETNLKLVKIELDLYWTVKAGHKPIEFMKKHPGRFVAFHVKDMDASEKGFFTEVGRGVINFGEIFQAGRKAGVELFIVEQDQTPGSPFDSLKVSYDYLNNLSF